MVTKTELPEAVTSDSSKAVQCGPDSPTVPRSNTPDNTPAATFSDDGLRTPARDGFTKIPNWFLDEYLPRLSPSASLLYMVLCSHADNKTRVCWRWLSIEVLANKLGVTPRAIRTHLQSLAQEGLIGIHSGKERGSVNTYVITDHGAKGRTFSAEGVGRKLPTPGKKSAEGVGSNLPTVNTSIPDSIENTNQHQSPGGGAFSSMKKTTKDEETPDITSDDPGAYRMPIGEHKGKPLSEIPRKYLDWARVNLVKPGVADAIERYKAAAEAKKTADSYPSPSQLSPVEQRWQSLESECARLGISMDTEEGRRWFDEKWAAMQAWQGYCDTSNAKYNMTVSEEICKGEFILQGLDPFTGGTIHPADENIPTLPDNGIPEIILPDDTESAPTFLLPGMPGHPTHDFPKELQEREAAKEAKAQEEERQREFVANLATLQIPNDPEEGKELAASLNRAVDQFRGNKDEQYYAALKAFKLTRCNCELQINGCEYATLRTAMENLLPLLVAGYANSPDTSADDQKLPGESDNPRRRKTTI